MPTPTPKRFHRAVAAAVFENLAGDPLLHALHRALAYALTSVSAQRVDLMRLAEQRAALVALAVASGDEAFHAVETTIGLPDAALARLDHLPVVLAAGNPVAAFVARTGRAPTYAEFEELLRDESAP